MEDRIDFLGIGDVVTDAFIALDPEHARAVEIDNMDTQLAVNLGDKIPYKQVDVLRGVGNAPNASVSAARQGLKSAIMTHVGADEEGSETIKTLAAKGVNTDYIQTEGGKKTNYHYVLRLGAERTILIKHDHFTYDLKSQVAGKPLPKWVYFSSVAENAFDYHAEVVDWCKENDIKIAFQPGSYQIFMGYEKLKHVYEQTEVFFCNIEEARRILVPVLGDSIKTCDKKTLLIEMKKLGPAIVCLTDGPDGAYMYDGTTAYFMPIYPDPKTPVERTGCGDSFASTFTIGLIEGKSPVEALNWAPINPMNVVQHIGAQEGLLTKAQIQEFWEKRPAHFKPEII